MKFNLLHLPMLAATSALMLTSCIDKNYDLSDIDTTSEFKVRDLTLPLNLEDVTLDDIIELESEDNIKIINGEYVIFTEGDFSATNVMIDRFHADSPKIDPNNTNLEAHLTTTKVSFDITPYSRSFEYNSKNIDSSIISVDKAWMDNLTLSIDLSISGIPASVKGLMLDNLVVMLPAGWECTPSAGKYDSATGCLSINSLAPQNGHFKITVDVKSASFNSSNSQINPATHSGSYYGSIDVKSGNISFEMPDGSASYDNCKLHTDYAMSAMDVVKFSGTIDYAIKNFNIAPVELGHIPDFFNNDETDLILQNPQLYLNITNPLAIYGANAQTGLGLTPVRNGIERTTCYLDNEFFSIGHDKGDKPQYFCLSPVRPAAYIANYAGAEYVKYTSLSGILSGNGIPSTINITAINPSYSNQKVEALELGKNLGKNFGSYTFFAPLAFKSGSKMLYNKINDGWNDEDIDCMNISRLTINADVTNNLPLEVQLFVYPLDKNGHRISGVTVEPIYVQPHSNGEPVQLVMTGDIRHLDGVEYVGRCTPDGEDTPLRPDQRIVLKNIKITATGNYVKEL